LNQKTLLAAIEHRLREHPLLKDSDPEFVRKYQARYSEIFEFRHRSQPKVAPILVKRRTGYASDELAEEMAAREFATLERLKERSGLALEGTVPLPLALFPELSAIAVSKLPGKDLRSILWRKVNILSGRFRQKQLGRITLLVGQWLRQFHESTRRPPTQFDDSAFLAEVKDWLDQCSSGGLERTTVEEIWELTSKVSQRGSGQLAVRAAKHGDFIPANILIAGEHIAVLDFEDFGECDVIYEDIGMLCAYFAFMRESPLYFRQAIDAMTLSFLQGYGDSGPKVLRDLYTMKAALNLSACQFQQGKSVPALSGKLQRFQKHLLGIAQSLLGKAAGPEQPTPEEPARSVRSGHE
jgi:tRNA A-37 threonylcarbamoyl transferase component Bud32